jgi:tetratricopeptide (TPR) repeat protein
VPATNEIPNPELINVPRDPILVNIASSPKFIRKVESTANPDEAFTWAIGIEAKEVSLGHKYPDNECAFQAYLDVLKIEPLYTAALVNLGTLHYNAGLFEKAKDYYILATRTNPNYALAFFDLGNTYDELPDLVRAEESYLRAVALAPDYADAHYNLALVYERQGRELKALKHWRIYCHLDPVGPWHNHASYRAKKIIQSTPLRLVTPESELEMEHIALKRVCSRRKSKIGPCAENIDQLWLSLG